MRTILSLIFIMLCGQTSQFYGPLQFIRRNLTYPLTTCFLSVFWHFQQCAFKISLEILHLIHTMNLCSLTKIQIYWVCGNIVNSGCRILSIVNQLCVNRKAVLTFHVACHLNDYEYTHIHNYSWLFVTILLLVLVR